MAKNVIELQPLAKVHAIPLRKPWALWGLEVGRPDTTNGLKCTMQLAKTLKNGVEPSTRKTFFAGDETALENYVTRIVKRTKLARDKIETVLGQMIEALDGELQALQASQEVDAAPKGRDSQATRLVKLALDANVELFHTAENECYGTMEIDGHKEHWLLKVRGFRRWLSHLYYREFDTSPGSQALQDALETLAGKALYDGLEIPVYTRLAQHENVIYLDLANAAWQAIAISDQGWQVSDNPPVKFRRSRGMLPLPLPVTGGSLQDLKPFVNLQPDGGAFILLVSWLIASLRPEGPYPVLVIHGEQGSAKSSLLRVVRSLLDPNMALLRSMPRDERDLIIAASNGLIIALDNLSHLPSWLSDALCRLSTGAGHGTRELWTNDEETIFMAQRPIVLNGIEELCTREDLLDRAILLYLQDIPKDKRKTEKTFWADFEQARPGILGALCDVVSQALAALPTVTMPELPRMADFALWAAAAAPACGWTADDFFKSYSAVQEDAYGLTLDASLIAPLVQEFVTVVPMPWAGTATDLLLALEELAHERAHKDPDAPGRDVTRDKTWPKNGWALSGALRRLAPTLRAIGIQIDFDSRAGTKSSRIITVSMPADATKAATPEPRREQKTF